MQAGSSAFRRHDPFAHFPRRVVPHVDRVAAGQIRQPETFLVLMKSNDWLLHLVSTPRAGCLWPIADAVGAVCDREFRQERRALTRLRRRWLLGGRNLRFLAD